MTHWMPKNNNEQRQQNHVIGRIIFEIHTDSITDFNNLEEEFRALIGHVIKPKLEEYCNEISEEDAVIHIDRLELDFGEVPIASLEESLNSRIVSCLGNPKRVRHSTIIKLKEEQSDLEKITYFLKTGLLPWRSVYKKAALLPSMWFQNLLQKDLRFVIEIIKKLINKQQHLQRFILNTTDETLMFLFKTAIVPTQMWAFFLDIKEIWDKHASFESSRVKRFHFWKIMICIFFDANLKTKETIFYNFIIRWAFCQRIPADLLIQELRQEIQNNSITLSDTAEIINIISQLLHRESGVNLCEANHGDNLLQLITEDIANQHQGVTPEGITKIQISLISGIFNVISLFTKEQRQELVGAIIEFLETLPSNVLPKSMMEYLRFHNDITPSKVSFIDDLRQMQGLLLKIDPTLKNDIIESNSIIKAIHELLNKNDHIDSVSQFVLFLEKLQPVIQALPPFMVTDELASYVVQLKAKLAHYNSNSADVDFLKMFYQLEKNFILSVKRMRADEVRSAIKGMNKILKTIPLSVFAFERQEYYKKIILMLMASETNMQARTQKAELFDGFRLLEDGNVKDQHETLDRVNDETDAEHDIYIHNAGLILIAPFAKSLFEKIGYVKENSFINGTVIQNAVMLLQYVVAPDEECAEYDLPLNKLLCGESVTSFIDVTIELDNDVELEADNMLSAILQQSDVFRNISPEGFRNAFLNREGVLNFRGDHWLLKVSKETFDIVLEKLSWQYHAVRLPWMNLPILIEW